MEHLPPSLAATRPHWSLGTGEPPPETADGDLLYAEDAVHDLYLSLSEEAMASLRLSPTTEVAAGLRWRGVRLDDVAVRIKGSRSERTIDEKPALKIDVHEWVPEQRIDGVKRLTLNNMVQDASMLHEHAYYGLCRRMGIPAPRHAYARLWVNGEAYGLYSLVETMDIEMIEHAFAGDEDGNLYEASPADLTWAEDWFELDRDGGVLPVWDDLEDLIDDVDAGMDGDFWAMLDARFDRDALLTYWAVDIASGNGDGYAFNRHNYHLYHAPLAERWTLVPWGTDQSFRKELDPWGSAGTPLEGALVEACRADVACADALATRLGAVLDVWEAELPALVERTTERIEGDCEADPRREDPCDLDQARSYVEERPGFLRAFL